MAGRVHAPATGTAVAQRTTGHTGSSRVSALLERRNATHFIGKREFDWIHHQELTAARDAVEPAIPTSPRAADAAWIAAQPAERPSALNGPNS